jgi:hypothetical protein
MRPTWLIEAGVSGAEAEPLLAGAVAAASGLARQEWERARR